MVVNAIKVANFELALSDFMSMVAEDPRIGPVHISLFLAILYYHKKQGFQSPVSVYSRELMKQAKISAGGTYHRCMRELQEYGFIRYVPSYNPMLGSLVYILKVIENESLHSKEARAK